MRCAAGKVTAVMAYSNGNMLGLWVLIDYLTCDVTAQTGTPDPTLISMM